MSAGASVDVGPGPGAGAGPGGSAIHDIGYRGYDGRRLGRGYILRSMFVHNLRAVYGFGRPTRTKVMPFLLAAAMLLPALASVSALAIFNQPEALIDYSAYAVYLQPVVAIFVASQAPVLACRDLRFHVVPLYFSRPSPRLDYVLAKYAAFSTGLIGLLGVPVLILYVGAQVTRQPGLGRHTADAAAAFGGAVIFALVLAAMGLVIASMAPRRGFGVAAVIAVYLVGVATEGVLASVLTFQLEDENTAGWTGLLNPFSLVDGIQVWAMSAESAAPTAPPTPHGGPVFALAALLIVGLSLAGMYLRFRRAGR
jgi:ABC-2 type transport system permease protein